MKPPFLTDPSAWTRAPRSVADPVRYASPIESPKPAHGWGLEDVLLFAVCLLALVLFFLGVI